MSQSKLRARTTILLVAAGALGSAPAFAVQLTQLTFGATSPTYEAYQSEPAWAPTGGMIAYSSSSVQHDGFGEPYLIIELVTPSGVAGPQFNPPIWILQHPTWSPDGARIAFMGGGLSLAPISNYNSVTHLSFQSARQPSWSPTGDRIAFDTGSGLAVIAASGGAPQSLPTGSAHNPAWSPDATKLAFDSGGQVWIFDLNLSTKTALTTGATTDAHPTWSPDGGWIAFSSQRSGSSALWVAAATGGAPMQLTSGATSDYEPAWSPDGHSIAFTSERGGAGPHVWIASDLPDFSVAVQQKSWSDVKELYRR